MLTNVEPVAYAVYKNLKRTENQRLEEFSTLQASQVLENVMKGCQSELQRQQRLLEDPEVQAE